MEQKSMTALMSAFSRAYHSRSNKVKIFDDSLAEKLLSAREYSTMAQSISGGISFFNSEFVGNSDEALRFAVDNCLSPLPLGRAVFAEKSLETALRLGTKQYLVLGAGYDTFAYRRRDLSDMLSVFEVDCREMSEDKRRRLEEANIEIPQNLHFIEADFTNTDLCEKIAEEGCFDRKKPAFCSILGVTYYLDRPIFERLFSSLSVLLTKGSTVVFDYPDEKSLTSAAGEHSRKQASLAAGANEKMFAGYSTIEIEDILDKYGFLIYEQLSPDDMTEQYFSLYNRANPSHMMRAPENAWYCLCVKK